tara:strand:+ start:123 stop:2681 length:2559 start_codon:yes stop_codon:yes gene_type:complete
MDPITQAFIQGAAGATGGGTFVDDVFSTYLYRGNGAARNEPNGIDLAGEGGLVWIKDRDQSNNHVLFDTERGVTKMLRLGDTSAGNEVVDSGVFSSFDSNGFTHGYWSGSGSTNIDYASWTFRNQPGFFKVVKWTGNGVSGRQIAHGLGSVPGFVMTKALDNSDNWRTLHSYDFSRILYVNTNAAEGSSGSSSQSFTGTICDATHLTVTADGSINANGQEYIAYVFAGGPSTAATARSVEFNGSNSHLYMNSTSDVAFGTGDFTFEAWVKPNNYTSAQYLFSIGDGDNFSCGITNNQWFYYSHGSSTKYGGTPAVGQWTHFAVARSSGTSKLFINGTEKNSWSDSVNFPNSDISIGRHKNSSTYYWNGNISNLRVVKGTAVYTTSFRPSYEPLTNITNTKLLCCNNASVTGSTVTPGTITATNATASTDNPFDDPEGFKFGDGEDQPIIKCGSYLGNSTANHEIYIGWEPQWWLVKNVTDSQNWQLLDSMRGWVINGNDKYLVPNNTSTDSSFNFGNPTPTGFNLSNASSNWQNESGKKYVYIAIRRPDGLVGKPAEAGTGVFAMDTGENRSIIPNYDSGFPVDFAFKRYIATTNDWQTSARLIQGSYVQVNTTAARASSSGEQYDSNVGYNTDQSPSTVQAWMWRRHPGFDVLNHNIVTASGQLVVKHNLTKTPEMIWQKNLGQSDTWVVYHKGLNGGSNPREYYVELNNTNAEGTQGNVNYWGRSGAMTSTSFEMNATYRYTGNTLFMLFASVDGISKVGYYNGTGSNQTLNLGFTPRFLLFKQTDGVRDWCVFDTLRGITSGNDPVLIFNTNAQYGGSDYLIPATNGIVLKSEPAINGSGSKYIYYAHA